MISSDRFSPTAEVLAAHLDGEAVLLHLGTKQYFRLNRAGAEIWKGLENGLPMEAVVDQLVDAFEVTRAVAKDSAFALVHELERSALVRSESGNNAVIELPPV